MTDRPLSAEQQGAPPPPEARSPRNAPPSHAIDIGTGHVIEFVNYKGEFAGINDWHRKSDGTWCVGWVPFRGSAWEKEFQNLTAWDVIQREPLTLTPSLLCRACSDHGFITNGRWVKV